MVKLRPLLLLLLLSSSLLTPIVYAAVQQYEYHNTGDDTWVNVDDRSSIYWIAQTFTVGSTAHNITSVKVKMGRYWQGVPITLVVEIRSTDGEGTPTNVVLTSGTMDGTTFEEGIIGSWGEVNVTEYTLSANTTYAIVPSIIAEHGFLRWRFETVGTYADGDDYWSYDSGETWGWTSDVSFMFEIWGTTPPVPETALPPSVDYWALLFPFIILLILADVMIKRGN